MNLINHSTKNTSSAAFASAALALSVLFSSSAIAHPFFEPSDASPGATYEGVLNIPHGCELEATTSITLRLDKSIFAGVAPASNGDWKAEVEDKGDAFQITWSGGNVAWDQNGVFKLSAEIAKGADTGEKYFPVIQKCTNNQTQRWIAVPKNDEEPDLPAAIFEVVAKGAKPSAGHSHGKMDPGKGHH
ncbi:MAG: YcnI family protein [Alphaproteobacteria bacterium]|nr:YcnI family protein [Alphaproteobacteria bacterium]